MDLGLRDRVYLVTGGSRGLGFAAAEALVAEGARIVLSSPDKQRPQRPQRGWARMPLGPTPSPGSPRTTATPAPRTG